jgi:hypothetical protein
VPNLDGDPAPWTRDPTFLLERAISLTATICWEWCRQKGDRFVLAVAGSRPVVWEGITGRELALRMLEGLAVQKGTQLFGQEPFTGVETAIDDDSLWECLQGVALPQGPVLVVSTRDGDLSEHLASRLRRPVASVFAAHLDNVDFYEPPGT